MCVKRFFICLFEKIKGLFSKKEKINLKKLDNKVNLRFIVVSDIHIAPGKITEINRFNKVIKAAYQLDSNIDAIAIVGDLTDNGSNIEYDLVKSCLCHKKVKTNLIASLGNHDGNSREKFKDVTGREPREDNIINGYHFITISPRFSENEYGGSRYNLDKDWLIEKVESAIKEDKYKPIFLFMHHGIKDTAYGTEERYTEDLGDVFSMYPNIIVFSGHSHFPLNDPRSIYQKDFTSINISTLSYFELESGMMYGTIPPNANMSYQALIVEANENVVRIRRLDLLSDSYIGNDWMVDIQKGKQEFKYTDVRSELSNIPYFTENDVIEVKDIGESNCTIVISHASIDKDENDDIVHSYKVEFINKDTGEIEKEERIWSEFYFLPRGEKLEQKFDGLKSQTEYVVRVKAYNSYQKESKTYLEGEFTTK